MTESNPSIVSTGNSVEKIDKVESEDNSSWDFNSSLVSAWNDMLSEKSSVLDEVGGETNVDAYDYDAELERQEKALEERYGMTSGPLKKEMIGPGLSNIGRAIGRTGMAFLTFEAIAKNLTDIEALVHYIHLTTVILSENKISNLCPLKGMSNLLVLNVEHNEIGGLDVIPLGHFKWLQALNLSFNKLQTLDFLHPNRLKYLHLANNNLTSDNYMNSKYFPNLLSLELRGNKLTSIKNMELPELRQLFIAENELQDLSGLNSCPKLERLHARNNKIRRIQIDVDLPKLEYINLRENKISRFTQTINLQNCKNLKTLILLGNPICDSTFYKDEICAACESLKRLDKEILLQIDKLEGRILHNKRMNGSVGPLEDDTTVAQSIDDENEGE